MKKIFLVLAFLPLAFTAKADGNSREILDRMAANMAEYENYRIDFTASSKGMITSVGGTYVVSGDKYHIKIQRQEQFSDGKTRWEINPSDKEVIVDHMDLDNRNILNNPTRAFKFAPDEFESTYLGVETVNNIPCHAIQLESLGRMYGIGIVKLHIGVAVELPVQVAYDFEGERLTVVIDKFTGLPSAEQSMFVFDESKYKGYEVIDFR